MSARPLPPFEVSPTYENQTARLSLRGELDMYSTPLLERELSHAVRRRPRQIVLDLAGLSFMDVSGLRTILDAGREVRRCGGTLVVANPLPHIVRLLELTAIDQSVEVLGRPLAAVS
jgi:anti-anti-sigma factor